MNYHPDMLSTVLKMITALVIVLGIYRFLFFETNVKERGRRIK